MKQGRAICMYSGGRQSALAAAMALKVHGKDKTIWLNNPVTGEPKDVARFEEEFAAHHGMDILYVEGDREKYPSLSPYEVVQHERGFGFKSAGGDNVLCTHRLKIQPTLDWLDKNYQKDDIVIYGYTAEETGRISRRSSILGSRNIITAYPLYNWSNKLDMDYFNKIGIEIPKQYKAFQHANCIPCIKGGIMHWLCVFVHDNDSYWKWSQLENEVGFSIHKEGYLDEYAELFEQIKALGVPIEENDNPRTFLASVKRLIKNAQPSMLKAFDQGTLPCECVV